MEDEQQVRGIFKFVRDVLGQENVHEVNCTKQLFTFVSAFTELHTQVEGKLPYHINVIDELHANENAHSRILAKLLQQKTENGRFEILERFINYLKKKSDAFGNIIIESPEITHETERIDLWIRDKSYAIIIENKIHRATDQSAQIERYIDVTKNYGFAEKQIYVIYLPPVYEKEPDKQSWGTYYGSEIRRDRYLNLSFRDDIPVWLQESILPNVRIKDVFLKSAIEQYIDHLEGIFDLRIIDKQIKMELQEFIKTELGLNGTPQENVARLVAKQEELNKVNNQLQLLKENTEKEIFREWHTDLSKTYPDYKLITEDTSAGLIIPVDDISVRVVIAFDSQLYCEVDMDHLSGTEKIIPESVKAKVEPILNRQNNNGQIWRYFPRYAYNEVYKCFVKVVKILTEDGNNI